MFVDLAADHTPHQVCWVLNEAAFRRRFNLGATLRAMERAGGHPGRGTLRRALELYAMGSAGTKSAYEDLFLTLVEPEPLVNMTLLGYQVDCQWPDRRLVVEVDGNHTRPLDERRDDARDETLTAAGYTVVRLSGKRGRGAQPAASAASSHSVSRRSRSAAFSLRRLLELAQAHVVGGRRGHLGVQRLLALAELLQRALEPGDLLARRAHDGLVRDGAFGAAGSGAALGRRSSRYCSIPPGRWRTLPSPVSA